MADQKSSNGVGSVLVDEFNDALRDCEFSARGFFFALIPLLESSRAYGCLDMDAEQLAEYFHVSLNHTRRYLYELKRKGILCEASNGSLICRLLVRKHYHL